MCGVEAIGTDRGGTMTIGEVDNAAPYGREFEYGSLWCTSLISVGIHVRQSLLGDTTS